MKYKAESIKMEAKRTTCGHKTFGMKWLFKHPATYQLFVTVNTNVARSPKRFIAREHYRQRLET